jgi:spore germination protein GerM
MGLSLPTTGENAATPPGIATPAPGGVRGWFASLSPRDRAIYAIMLGMLALIITIYLFAGLRTFFGGGGTSSGQPTPAATAGPISGIGTAVPTGAVATSAPSAALPTPTELPTNVPQPTPTEPAPTQPPLLLPTRAPSQATATSGPSAATSGPAVATSVLPPATSGSSATTSAPPAATSAPPAATSQPPAATSRPSVATSAPPAATSQPPAATSRPSVATSTPPLPPQPTRAPAASTSTRSLTLYFGDASGTMFVPVQRSVQVVDDRVAQAAVEALIAGPRNGLQRLVLSDARLLGIQIAGGTATLNFDRRPAGTGDNRGLLSIMYTLIEFPSITRVQIQVNGRNIGLDGDGPIAWRPINALNPAGLPQDYGQTAFLPLYFVADNGRHDVRVIRMVPKTTEVARATVNALIEGPLDYSDRVWSPIPGDTELRGIKKDGSTIIVDFTQPFAEAPDRDIAVRTVVESLTTLPGVNGVLFLVEGKSLSEQWGQRYGRTFGRVAINQE